MSVSRRASVASSVRSRAKSAGRDAKRKAAAAGAGAGAPAATGDNVGALRKNKVGILENFHLTSEFAAFL